MELAERKDQALSLVNWLIEVALEGWGPLDSAEELAQEYLNDRSYRNNDERVDSLINWESVKNFSTGFLTSLGGPATLPASVAGSVAASWAIQARMIGAIAYIYGHNIREERVKTLILACLLGDKFVKEVLKKVGVQIGKNVAKQVIMKKIPGRVLIEINKKIGFRLLTKAGERGVINLIKVVPLIGGAIGGGVDAAACQTVGEIAKKVFRPKNN